MVQNPQNKENRHPVIADDRVEKPSPIPDAKDPGAFDFMKERRSGANLGGHPLLETDF